MCHGVNSGAAIEFQFAGVSGFQACLSYHIGSLDTELSCQDLACGPYLAVLPPCAAFLRCSDYIATPATLVFVRLPLPAVVHTAAMHLAATLPRGVPTWTAPCATVRRCRRREGHQDLRWRTKRQHQKVGLDDSKSALQAEPLTASRSTCKSQLFVTVVIECFNPMNYRSSTAPCQQQPRCAPTPKLVKRAPPSMESLMYNRFRRDSNLSIEAVLPAIIVIRHDARRRVQRHRVQILVLAASILTMDSPGTPYGALGARWRSPYSDSMASACCGVSPSFLRP